MSGAPVKSSRGTRGNGGTEMRKTQHSVLAVILALSCLTCFTVAAEQASHAAKKERPRQAARLVRVVDGDTVRLEIEIEPGVWQEHSCRLRRVDAPELPTKAGKKAKQELERFLSGSLTRLVQEGSGAARRSYVSRTLTVEPHGQDKYRRLLVELWASGDRKDAPEINVSDWLLERRLAQPWPHEKKQDAPGEEPFRKMESPQSK